MEKVVTRIVQILCLCVMLLGGVLHGQVSTPPLERVVSLQLKGNSTKEALKIVEEKASFSFAYRTDLVEQSNAMSRTYAEQTVREVLDDIFQGRVSYKTKGNYVILRDVPKPSSNEVVLEGYIVNSLDNSKIPYASIYDTTTFASAVSDEYGHYTIRLSTKEDIVLKVRKSGFVDTTFNWIGEDPNVFNIAIQPLIAMPVSDSLSSADSLVSDRKRLKDMKFFNPSEEQKANLLNFTENLKRKVQVSVLPGIGTNGRLSGVTKVDYSLNLLGGFNGGVRVAEIGTIFNIDWDSVSYFQAAGVLNAVGGPQVGGQFAGFANLNNDSFKGGQFGGFLNIVRRDMRGGQFAGFWNYMGDSSKAIQAAGYANVAGINSKGIQLAGFGNYARRGFKGIQASGFGNFVGKNGRGAQLAGFVNIADSNFRGAQIAGFANVAGKIKGTQIGFINVNDSIDGFALGFLTFSRKGLHQLELSGNEVFPLNLAFKTGTNSFYNSFTAGMRFDDGTNQTWNVGYGIGTSVRASTKSRVFFDLQGHAIQRGTDFSSASNLNKLTVSYQYNFTDKIAIAAGPSLNLLFVENDYPNASHYSSLAPYDFLNGSINSTVDAHMWVGGHLALRFF